MGQKGPVSSGLKRFKDQGSNWKDIILLYLQAHMIKNIQRTLPKSVSNPRKGFSSSSPHRQINADSSALNRTTQQNDNKQKLSSTENLSKPRKNLSIGSNRFENGDFEVYLENSIRQMTEKKEKLESCIKFFNLMQSHNAQLRCLTHSNVLTIYCQTQRRALCANCVYGVTKHRTHRLIPLKDANELIVQDNAMLWKLIESDLMGMDQSVKNVQDTTLIFEKSLKNKLRQIDEEYAEKAEELKNKYAGRKKNIQLVYDKMINNSRTLEKILEEFKFKIWETLSKVGIGKRSEGNNSDIEVSKQVLCVSMSEISKVLIRRISDRDQEKIHHKIIKL